MTPALDSSRLVRDGAPQLGIFPEPVRLINHRDCELRTPMGRRVGRLGRALRFHQFQYFGAMSPALMLGCAVVDLGYLGTAFAYVYRPATRDLRRWSFRAPFARGVTSSLSPVEGVTAFHRRGAVIEMTAQPEPRGRRLGVRIPGELEVDAAFSEADPPLRPMALCTQAGSEGWVYAQKVAGVPVTGRVACALGEHDLAAIDAHAHHDWSAGYMRRETFWRWACFSGRSAAGERLGLNVSCGVNETSFTESCLWIDGALVKVDSVAFAFDRDRPEVPWRITSFDGQVDLRFHPESCHAERVNAWLLATNFKHYLGRFEGTLRPGGGRAVEVRDLYGLAEDHYAKW